MPQRRCRSWDEVSRGSDLPWLTLLSMHFALVHACCGGRIVAIVSPRRMIEVNYEITVVRNDGVIENNFADAPPVAESAALKKTWPMTGAVVCNFDMKGQCAN